MEIVDRKEEEEEEDDRDMRIKQGKEGKKKAHTHPTNVDSTTANAPTATPSVVGSEFWLL